MQKPCIHYNFRVKHTSAVETQLSSIQICSTIHSLKNAKKGISFGNTTKNKNCKLNAYLTIRKCFPWSHKMYYFLYICNVKLRTRVSYWISIESLLLHSVCILRHSFEWSYSAYKITIFIIRFKFEKVRFTAVNLYYQMK